MNTQAPAPAPPEPFTLVGDGYALVVPPEAEKTKQLLIEQSMGIVTVTSNEESALAQFEIRKLAGLRIEVENARKKVKAPVIALGKQIDGAAASFIATVIGEEDRLKSLVGNHAKEVERLRKLAEAEERQRAEEARKAAEAAERARQEEAAARERAANAISIQDAIEARRKQREAEAAAAAANEEKQSALADRREASAVVITTRLNEGIRFTDEIEVTDIRAFHAAQPDLVSMAIRTAEVKALIKSIRDEGKEPSFPGLRITRKPVVSTR